LLICMYPFFWAVVPVVVCFYSMKEVDYWISWLYSSVCVHMVVLLIWISITIGERWEIQTTRQDKIICASLACSARWVVSFFYIGVVLKLITILQHDL
jgi:hypothetical protein